MIKYRYFTYVAILLIAVGLLACSSYSAQSDDEAETLLSKVSVIYVTETVGDAEADDLVYKESEVPVVSLREGNAVCIEPHMDYENVCITLDGEVVESVGDLSAYSSYEFTAEDTGMYIIYATVDGEVKNVTEEFGVLTVTYAE